MGIKFHCPNGHKLNVKSFLAGKKGVCPKCGTKLRIPTASEVGLGGDDEAEESDLDKQLPAVGGNGAGKTAVAVAQVQPTPAALPAIGKPAAGPAVPAVVPAPTAIPAGPAPAPVSQPTPGDPIAEAPMAIWYVRPPSGGQFGPARGDVMRKWLAEGRVSSDSLVWREGWTDWQSAGKLFPQLQAASTPAAAAATTTAAPAAGVVRAARTVNRYQAKKASSSSLGVALLIFLAIVCVVLVAVLVYVLFNMSR